MNWCPGVICLSLLSPIARTAEVAACSIRSRARSLVVDVVLPQLGGVFPPAGVDPVEPGDIAAGPVVDLQLVRVAELEPVDHSSELDGLGDRRLGVEAFPPGVRRNGRPG